MLNNDSKVCRYCSSTFHRVDFPHCFDRMITCGNVGCEGQRRKELWRKRYTNMMKANARAG